MRLFEFIPTLYNFIPNIFYVTNGISNKIPKIFNYYYRKFCNHVNRCIIYHIVCNIVNSFGHTLLFHSAPDGNSGFGEKTRQLGYPVKFGIMKPDIIRSIHLYKQPDVRINIRWIINYRFDKFFQGRIKDFDIIYRTLKCNIVGIN